MFYCDTAIQGNTPALMCAYEFFGADHMVFATDTPYDNQLGERVDARNDRGRRRRCRSTRRAGRRSSRTTPAGCSGCRCRPAVRDHPTIRASAAASRRRQPLGQESRAPAQSHAAPTARPRRCEAPSAAAVSARRSALPGANRRQQYPIPCSSVRTRTPVSGRIGTSSSDTIARSSVQSNDPLMPSSRYASSMRGLRVV